MTLIKKWLVYILMVSTVVAPVIMNEISLDKVNAATSSTTKKVVKKTTTKKVVKKQVKKITQTYRKNGTTFHQYVKAEKTSRIERSATYKKVQSAAKYKGKVLTRSAGVVKGPNGKETYYNLNMKNVVRNMQRKGYKETYWVRSDGVKMFGNYVMTAADQSKRPLGSIYETSLGLAIVCDTGSFVKHNSQQSDIAVKW